MLAALRHRSYKQALLSRLNGSDPAAELPAGGRTEERFIEALFVCMGKLAKLNGSVTRAEIEFGNQTMQRLDLQNGSRKFAITCFDLGKQPHIDVIPYLQSLVSSIGVHSDLAEQFLRLLCRLVQIKGVIQLQEKILLRDIAEVLGYDKSELLEICGENNPPKVARSAHMSSVLRDAYSTLELDTTASDSEIRKAYLRLMSRFHPDKIRRANVNQESLKFAQEQSMAVRAAYETVCGFRKIRA